MNPRKQQNPGRRSARSPRIVLSGMFAALLAATALGGPVPRPQAPDVPPHEPVPSAQQLAWHERELYAFIHFGMNTFTGVEWGHGTETPDTFQPTELDCNQWCALFAECGLTGVIITAKHHDGFCLWPSAFTEHDVASSSWKDGQGDVIRELADACQRHGLWLGIYISPWDRNNPIYGTDDDAYNRYFIGQMKELLGGYGEVAEVWWDGANGDRNNPDKHQEYDWPAFVRTVAELQPGAVIFAPPRGGATVRWIGNEGGYAGATQWATFDRKLGEHNASLHTGVEGAEEWIPAETNTSIRPGWYWHPNTDERVKSVEKLLDIYYNSVGHNTNFLLNFPVDSRGLVHENDAAALRALTAITKATFLRDLARGRAVVADSVRGKDPRFAAGLVTDGDEETFWATDDGVTTGRLTVELDGPTPFNRVVLREHIELGQRVRQWRLFARIDGAWEEIFEGTTIGHRRIARFDTVVADAIRVDITDSRACPTIETLGVFVAPAEVTIRPGSGAFLDQADVSLAADLPGCTIHYTLDGSEPTPESPKFEKPLPIQESCTVRAVAVRGGTASPLIAEAELVAYDRKTLRTPISFFRKPDSGLQVDRYEGGWQTLDQLKEREPASSGLSETFDVGERSRDEHAALVFTGFLNAPADGVYSFFLTSDDGSRLSIGEDRIIDGDGLHGMVERSGMIGLQAGYHPIRVEWFNATGGLGLKVEWAGGNLERQAIPASALAH